MLNIKQQTIQKSVTLSGVGLHTGAKTNMTFVPAKPNHGIKFQRVDLPGSPIIDADCDNVSRHVSTRNYHRTKWWSKVSTIEHTLAALVGLRN
jgi:UDP-3-O-[3-hydroxymyristoyl] N-acetylglucosamine deacetylase/3-hydroxyacyl-[acyl-carrier-protein] dehydratase